MYCPKCGTENPDDAQLCSSCSWVLTSTSTVAPAPDAKTSGLAITSLVLGILSFFTLCLTALPAIILGIVGIFQIEKSAGQLKGKGLAIAGIAVPAASLPLALFLLGGVITYITHPVESGTEVFKGQLVWVKCSNPDCEEAYQMDKKVYFDSVEELVRQNPMSMQTPPLVCQKCGKENIYRAEKCEKCGLIFFRGAAGRGDFADRCPECGYSRSEEIRKRVREGVRQSG